MISNVGIRRQNQNEKENAVGRPDALLEPECAQGAETSEQLAKDWRKQRARGPRSPAMGQNGHLGSFEEKSKDRPGYAKDTFTNSARISERKDKACFPEGRKLLE